MFFECFLDSHALLNIFFHAIVCLDESWQHRDNIADLILRNHNDTIHSIAEDQISRVYDGPIKIQRHLDCVWLCLGAGPRDPCAFRPDLDTHCE
jgi:hypothetical protein